MIFEQLRQPMKLRLVLAAALLSSWYFLFYGPLSERLAAATALIDIEIKRIAIAREIDHLDKTLSLVHGRANTGADVNELIRQLMDHLRPSNLKLIDLKPEKPQEIGPYETSGLRLILEGGFAEIDEFLGWVENNQTLMRIDMIRLDPATHGPKRLTAQIVVAALFEKPASAAKTTSPSGAAR
jgi:hypothetical protein